MVDLSVDTEIKEEKSNHTKKFVIIAGTLILIIFVIAIGAGFQGQKNKDLEEVNAVQNDSKRKIVLQSQSFENGFSNYKKNPVIAPEVNSQVVARQPQSSIPAWEQDLMIKKRRKALEALQGDMQLEESLEDVGSNAGDDEIDPETYVAERTGQIDSNISALEAQLKALEAK